ncbi:DNA-binding CsgD family transcriptional regulator [Desulfosalsimonas propionicica]|uniref:DNA-binding CsgD family transcriptional regulator n=1 Tax=Desulfosalsimonas propionicica TaxID=332175 RepID=A0A7W0C855_9BACT|nr:helix-turn-helix transcriptional regulator [Desulfosalsimonas propionicica]MBA2880936.1 DNA-binding CsgD family transcriptional regulator [Desulfosalsimonas propionicica]
MTEKSLYTYPVLCFAAFVFWLVSVPMDGPLAGAAGVANASAAFLPIHVAALLLLGLFCPRQAFFRLVPAGCLATAVLTLLLFFKPSAGSWILACMGASGAVVAIAACVTLCQSPVPLLCAAAGLVMGNLLVLPVLLRPLDSFWIFAAVAVFLLAIPVLAAHLPDPEPMEMPDETGPWHYLPFILLFKVICGLMYVIVMPAYHQEAAFPGFEMLFYVAAVFGAYRLTRINRDLALIGGVVLGMAAFTIMQTAPGLFSANAGMFALQAATGMVDLVLIAVLLDLADPVRAFGIGLAIVCTGIAAGELMGRYFAGMTGAIAMTGHFVLNLSVLVLYFLGRYGYISSAGSAQTPGLAETKPGPAAVAEAGPAAPVPDPGRDRPGSAAGEDEVEKKMPRYLRMLLSEREYLVLKKVLAGKTYRQTALELALSESTVKTYMHRVYEKMGVSGKKKLFEKLSNL